LRPRASASKGSVTAAQARCASRSASKLAGSSAKERRLATRPICLGVTGAPGNPGTVAQARFQLQIALACAIAGFRIRFLKREVDPEFLKDRIMDCRRRDPLGRAEP